MRRERPSSGLPPSHGPVYLVMLWPDPARAGRWQGRLKDVRDGFERHLEGLEHLETLLDELERRRPTWDHDSSARS